MKDGTRGCFRDASACHFVHPHEREWETAQPSCPPRHDNVVDSDQDFFYVLAHPDRRDREKEKRNRDGDRERDKDKARERDRKPNSSFHSGSPPHRRDSATTRASIESSSRRSTIDSGAVDGGATAKRRRSPALSNSSDQLEKLRMDDKHRTKDLPLFRQDHSPSTSRRSRSRSWDKGRERERAGLPSKPPFLGSHILDTRDPLVPVAQRLPIVPPEPPNPPPMQPAPPAPQLPGVPNVPSFVSTQQPTSSVGSASRGLKELSMDEQRSAWHERIEYAHIIPHLVPS